MYLPEPATSIWYMLHTQLFQCLAIPANLGVGTLCHPTACMEGLTNPSYHSPLMAMLRYGNIKYSNRRFSCPDYLSCLGSLVPSARLLFCYYKVGGYFITPTAALIQISLYFSEYFCKFSLIFPLSMMKCYNKILWLTLYFWYGFFNSVNTCAQFFFPADLANSFFLFSFFVSARPRAQQSTVNTVNHREVYTVNLVVLGLNCWCAFLCKVGHIPDFSLTLQLPFVAQTVPYTVWYKLSMLYKLYMVQAISGTCHIWYRSYIVKAISGTSHIWYKPSLVQAIYGTSHLGYKQ